MKIHFYLKQRIIKFYQESKNDKRIIILYEFLQKNVWVILLLFISALAFHRWFSFSIFSKSDWPYLFPETLNEYFNYNTWSVRTNLGSPDSTIWRFPYYYLIGLMSRLNLGYSVIEKILVFWPIIVLTPIAGYNLGRSFKLDKVSSFICGLIFSFNTYFLAIITQGHILLNLAFAIATFGYLNFKRGLETKKNKYFFYSLILSTIAGFVDFRCLYILIFILFIYCILNLRQVLNNFFKLCLWGLSLIAMNLFWIIPFLTFSNAFGTDVLDRDLFGNRFWRLNYSIALFHPFWTGSKTSWFITNPIPPIFWILPFFSLVGIIILFATKSIRLAVFLSILGITGILLTKQSDIPFPNLYPWLFDNFTGFKAFRESSKFYYLITLSYCLSTGYLINFINIHKKHLWVKITNFIIFSSIILLSFLNILPYLNNSISTLTTPRSVPTQYQKLNSLIQSENEFYRTLWIPKTSQWVQETRLNPKISLTDLITKYLTNIHQSNEFEDFDLTKTDTFIKYINMNYFEYLIKSVSVKYIIVPIQDIENDDDFFTYYGNERDKIEKTLDTKTFLNKSNLSDSRIAIYEVANYQSEAMLSSEAVISLSEASKFETKFDFTTNILGFKNPYFVSNNEQENKDSRNDRNTINISDPFSEITPKNIDFKNGTINTDKQMSDFDQLFLNKRNYTLSSILIDDTLELFLEGSGNNFKNLMNESNIKKIYIKKYKIISDQIYFLKYNEDYLRINPGKTVYGNYEPNSEYKLVTNYPENIVKNGDFDNGLWHDEVYDCNEYEILKNKNEVLKANLIVNETDNSNALNLSASAHTACLQQIVATKPQTSYIFQYKYKVPEIGKGFSSFNLGFLDLYNKELPNNFINLKQRIYINEKEWTTFSKFFVSPKDNYRTEISLYAEYLDQYNSVYYDDISLFEVNVIDSQLLPEIPTEYENFKIDELFTKGLVLQSYYDIRNNAVNGDFEKGLWQKSVGNCNKSDNDPQINMILNNENDNNYLELTSKANLACTSNEFSFNENSSQLLLNFDYYTTSEYIGYYIYFNDLNNKLIKGNLPILKKDRGKWFNFNEIINIPPGATGGSFGFYGYPGNFTVDQNLGITKYDNLKLINIPRVNGISFFSSGDYNLNNKINYKELKDMNNNSKPSQKKFTADGKFSYSSLSFNNQFDNYWELKGLENTKHYKTIFNTNVWSLDNKNNQEEIQIDLEYSPQKSFERLLPYSMGFLSLNIIVVLYLVIFDIKKSKTLFSIPQNKN
jgi:hypothetical protein